MTKCCMNKQAVFFIGISIFLLSCKTTQTIFNRNVKPASAYELDDKLEEKKVVFQTFSGKAKVDVASANINQSFSAQIDILKDSVIGLSLRVLGVEGARVKITPDSIEIIDRLNQEYIPRDIEFIKSSFNIDADFYDLQNLIVGNPVYYDTTALDTGESDDKYVLLAENAVYKNTLWLSPDYDILRMFIQDLIANRTLTLDYDAYEKIEGRQFAFIRNIFIDAQDDLTAHIEFTKVEFDQPFGFTFTVNPKYKRID